MKPEEREELKQNDLENWLQYGLPIFLKQYGSYLLLAAALCLLGYQLWGYYDKKKAIEVQSAWNELETASSPNVENAPAKLQAIISQYQIKPIQALAWLQMATFYTDAVAAGNPPSGYNGVKVTRDDALKSAEESANHVVSDFPDETLAVGKAHLVLATVAMDRGDWDGARKQLETLSDKSGRFAETPFAKMAEFQLSKLDTFKKAPPLASLVPPEPAASQPVLPDRFSQFPPLPGQNSAPSFGQTETPFTMPAPATQK